MNNWYAIETEAKFRRREWERASEDDARAAQARPANGTTRLSRIARLLTNLNLTGLSVPRLGFAPRLEPDCRTATC